MSKPAHLAPTAFFILFPCSIILTFFIALKFKHITVLFPYISDTGDKLPESNVFSMFVSLCSVTLAVTVYVRHLQIDQHLSYSKNDRKIALWNNISTGFGMVSGFGLLLVANFQEDNCYPIHYTGAAACIWGGVIYLIFQTIISYLMREYLISLCVLYLRVLLCTFSFHFMVIGMVSTIGALKHAPTGVPLNSTVSLWTPSDTYWVVHVLSTVSEWTLALLQSVLILTFVQELRRMKVVFPKLKIIGISPEIR